MFNVHFFQEGPNVIKVGVAFVVGKQFVVEREYLIVHFFWCLISSGGLSLVSMKISDRLTKFLPQV